MEWHLATRRDGTIVQCVYTEPSDVSEAVVLGPLARGFLPLDTAGGPTATSGAAAWHWRIASDGETSAGAADPPLRAAWLAA